MTTDTPQETVGAGPPLGGAHEALKLLDAHHEARQVNYGLSQTEFEALRRELREAYECVAALTRRADALSGRFEATDPRSRVVRAFRGAHQVHGGRHGSH